MKLQAANVNNYIKIPAAHLAILYCAAGKAPASYFINSYLCFRAVLAQNCPNICKLAIEY